MKINVLVETWGKEGLPSDILATPHMFIIDQYRDLDEVYEFFPHTILVWSGPIDNYYKIIPQIEEPGIELPDFASWIINPELFLTSSVVANLEAYDLDDELQRILQEYELAEFRNEFDNAYDDASDYVGIDSWSDSGPITKVKISSIQLVFDQQNYFEKMLASIGLSNLTELGYVTFALPSSIDDVDRTYLQEILQVPPEMINYY